MPFQSLANQFLIAMPGLANGDFARTVTYLCEHNPDGALGIVINRQADLRLGAVLAHMDITPRDPDIVEHPVYIGGPVQTARGFVLHQPLAGWESTLAVSSSTGLTTSRDILLDMAMGRGPGQSLLALGYAGWGAGQLETELLNNSWLNCPMDGRILFDLPSEQRWHAALSALGVDPNLLTGDVGHA